LLHCLLIDIFSGRSDYVSFGSTYKSTAVEDSLGNNAVHGCLYFGRREFRFRIIDPDGALLTFCIEEYQYQRLVQANPSFRQLLGGRSVPLNVDKSILLSDENLGNGIGLQAGDGCSYVIQILVGSFTFDIGIGTSADKLFAVSVNAQVIRQLQGSGNISDFKGHFAHLLMGNLGF
jgi:hypothetical protein